MAKVMKKPVVVEAYKFDPPSLILGVNDFVKFIAPAKYYIVYDANHNIIGLDIHTLEGVMRADVGDWIIRGVKGEYYPCKADVFTATYDVVYEVV